MCAHARACVLMGEEGAIACRVSSTIHSFSNGLIEHVEYTRVPPTFSSATALRGQSIGQPPKSLVGHSEVCAGEAAQTRTGSHERALLPDQVTLHRRVCVDISDRLRELQPRSQPERRAWCPSSAAANDAHHQRLRPRRYSLRGSPTGRDERRNAARVAHASAEGGSIIQQDAVERLGLQPGALAVRRRAARLRERAA